MKTFTITLDIDVEREKLAIDVVRALSDLINAGDTSVIKDVTLVEIKEKKDES
jgi:hypothetical protein